MNTLAENYESHRLNAEKIYFQQQDLYDKYNCGRHDINELSGGEFQRLQNELDREVAIMNTLKLKR